MYSFIGILSIYIFEIIHFKKGRRISPTPQLLSGFIFSYLCYFLFCLHFHNHTASNCSNIALIIRFLLICDRQEKPERNIHIPIRLISEWNICMPLCPCYLLLYDYQAMPVVMINRAYPDALCFNHLLLRHEKSTLVVF